jgi:broad specificity phosphatase PhoE
MSLIATTGRDTVPRDIIAIDRGPDALMALLLLIRHAAHAIDPTVPHTQWPLSKRGVSAAKTLGLALRTDVLEVRASPQPKAADTARHAFGDFTTDERLVEADRPFYEDVEELRSDSRRWLSGEWLVDWERREDVVDRMTWATMGMPSRTCFVSHGMAITVLVNAITGVPTAEFLSRMPMPAAYWLDTSRGTVIQAH